MPRNLVKEKAFPVGIFIILSTLLIVIGLIWLRGLAARPEYTFSVRYKNPDPIGRGVAVYYRGVQVGRVLEVALAPDFDSTLVQIGIMMPHLRLPHSVAPHIRLEGITGQRYIDLQPSKSPSRITAYISDGEVIEGVASLTWERIQGQLAKIAEERVLEKILVSTQRTVKMLAAVAVRLDNFLDENEDAFQVAAGRFDQTADEVAMAARKFGEFSNTADNAIPRITTSIETFSENTRNMDEALVNVSQAAERVGSTVETLGGEVQETGLINNWAQAGSDVRQATGSFQKTTGQLGHTLESVNRQLIQTDLIPNLSGTIGELRGGGSIVGEPQQPIPVALLRLNGLLAELHQANRSLNNTLEGISPQHMIANGQRDLQSLQRLSALIGQAPQAIRPEMLAGQTPQEIQGQLYQLRLFGQLISAAISRLRPSFMGAIGLPAPQQQSLLRDMGYLERLGNSLSTHIVMIEPRIGIWMEQLPKPKPSLLSSVRSTIQQVNQAAARFECTATELNHMLNQRFLGFRLFFGKPGSGFDCATVVKIPEHSKSKSK